MEAFFNSVYFWPVMVVLLLALFVVVIWTALSGKKKDKKLEEEQTTKVIEEVVTTVPTPRDIEEVKKEIEAKTEAIENEADLPVEKEVVVEEVAPVVEEVKEEVVEPRKEVAPDAPKIEIPINDMDDSAITVEKTGVLEEQAEAQVEVPVTEQVKEEIVETEHIEVEFSKPLEASLDVGESIPVPEQEEMVQETGEAIEVEKTTQLEEVAEEQVEIPKEETVEVPAEKEVEMPELNNAFEAEPTEDNAINEDIVVEEPKEYTGEKTEIFDFPDFSDIPGGEVKEEELTIDEEIIKVAEEYVSSVMHR